MPSQFFAYTFHVPEPCNSIVIPIGLGVSLPIPGVSPEQRVKVEATALVDTGASGSCISEAFARKFNLKAFSMSKVHTAKGEDIRPRYYMVFSFRIPPNNLHIDYEKQ